VELGDGEKGKERASTITKYVTSVKVEGIMIYIECS
jgi:hypothetical protein